MWWWYTWIGFVHLLQSRSTRRSFRLEKGEPRAESLEHAFVLAAAYGLKGELELARTELVEAKRLGHSDRYRASRTRANGDLYTPALRDRMETLLPRYPRRWTAGRMKAIRRLATIARRRVPEWSISLSARSAAADFGSGRSRSRG